MKVTSTLKNVLNQAGSVLNTRGCERTQSAFTRQLRLFLERLVLQVGCMIAMCSASPRYMRTSTVHKLIGALDQPARGNCPERPPRLIDPPDTQSQHILFGKLSGLQTSLPEMNDLTLQNQFLRRISFLWAYLTAFLPKRATPVSMVGLSVPRRVSVAICMLLSAYPKMMDRFQTM